MKTKYFFLAAIAGMTLVSCSNDEYIGDNSPTLGEGNGAIGFSMNVPNATRADTYNNHETSAAKLGNQFIVWGEKSEPGDGAAGTAVFTNYQVNYTASTAYTTTSNTLDWEYVGYTHSSEYQASISPKLTAAQTIKYWDYSATNYTFTAVSAQQSDITAGNVKITKKTTDDSGDDDVYGKGYSVTINKDADLTKLYFADRVPVAQGTGVDRHAVNAYGGNVTLTFRNAQSQIRVGMYETISGYSVKIKKFYYKEASAPANFAAMDAYSTTNFAANVPNIKQPTDASTLTFNVTYQKSGTLLNQPIVSPTGSANPYLTLGTNVIDATTLGTSAYNATFDEGGAYTATTNYTPVFPQEGNTTNLKLKIDYTLTSLDGSGETIDINGATAEIPAQFLTWKPNYKYTYLFKISENTNGSSGGGVVGLYPITFDAVQVVDGDGLAEYITTVSEPSITTFGVKGGKYTTVGSTYDYPAATDVYAVVEDNSGLATLSGTETKIYEVSTSDATNFPITEASVAEALIEGPTLTKAQADLAKITYVAGPALTFQNTVPAEDGTTIELDATLNKAAKFTTVTGKKYAIVYEKTAATYSVSAAQTFADETAFNNAGTLYTTSACTAVATWVDSSTEYYKRTAVTNKGVYAIKIVTVE